jgi:hypothetical protein
VALNKRNGFLSSPETTNRAWVNYGPGLIGYCSGDIYWWAIRQIFWAQLEESRRRRFKAGIYFILFFTILENMYPLQILQIYTTTVVWYDIWGQPSYDTTVGCSNRHITRPEHFMGRAEKILPMPIPWDVSGLNFRAMLGRGPELGRAARAFYSVKELKTSFRAGLAPKKNSRVSRSVPTPAQ